MYLNPCNPTILLLGIKPTEMDTLHLSEDIWKNIQSDTVHHICHKNCVAYLLLRSGGGGGDLAKSLPKCPSTVEQINACGIFM